MRLSFFSVCWSCGLADGSSEGAASLNDMKDMLASLPQYQEQREKVGSVQSLLGGQAVDASFSSRCI